MDIYQRPDKVRAKCVAVAGGGGGGGTVTTTEMQPVSQ